MTSLQSLFKFKESTAVAPINCDECAANAYCIRREPKGEDIELQTFLCSECATLSQRTRDFGISDADVQKVAEKLLGFGRR